MDIAHAILLGIIQGLAEFLPISSSAHLVLLEHYLGVQEAGLTFDILLHVGTLVALIAYFWQDWQGMAAALWRPGRHNRFERRLFWYLVIATLPGAAAGYFLEKQAETIFRTPTRIAVLLAVLGILLYLADRVARHQRRLPGITLKDAVLVGCAQALAIMPGVSRSGSTMTMGLFLGLTRETAARFSFLMSAPIIFGAGVHQGLKLLKSGANNFLTLPYVLGFLAAIVSSYLTIRYLLRFLQRHTFIIFVLYRLLLAFVVLGLEYYQVGPK
ncbi:undecaprenyl-diphosphatase UppP [Desulfobacca acetoxidans]|uniref:Undecaprenyl-diphosphatase n=1 Tax=Desulfobacca acetoxidans (strain ATCC 700848 / DSM 11109 / ASRB2) TaxID=880072 RepID=F2NF16_DESAR|nr:undecaprenyl-diphosphatase UppP [Desulfobacca acetoxidans]AEB08356.1 Undecaprenyl-diphosphatase [Desulfobacca acetoxidans DSM 11109]